MAGVRGAKEGEACGTEDNDTCSVSLYKASGHDLTAEWEGLLGHQASHLRGLSTCKENTVGCLLTQDVEATILGTGMQQ